MIGKGTDLSSGYYGDPPRIRIYLKQLVIFLSALVLMKLTVILVLSIFTAFFLALAEFILYPVLVWNNEKLELITVMLVVPLMMNAMQFWVVDGVIKQGGRLKNVDQLQQWKRARTSIDVERQPTSPIQGDFTDGFMERGDAEEADERTLDILHYDAASPRRPVSGLSEQTAHRRKSRFGDSHVGYDPIHGSRLEESIILDVGIEESSSVSSIGGVSTMSSIGTGNSSGLEATDRTVLLGRPKLPLLTSKHKNA